MLDRGGRGRGNAAANPQHSVSEPQPSTSSTAQHVTGTTTYPCRVKGCMTKHCFSNPRRRRNHEYRHGNKGTILVCDSEECKEEFSTIADLNNHTKGKHLPGRKFQCSFCDVFCSTKCTQIKHENLQHPEEAKASDELGRLLGGREIHGSPHEPWVCRIADIRNCHQWKRRTGVVRHMALYHKDTDSFRRLSCRFYTCLYQAPNSDTQERHEREVHNGLGPEVIDPQVLLFEYHQLRPNAQGSTASAYSYPIPGQQPSYDTTVPSFGQQTGFGYETPYQEHFLDAQSFTARTPGYLQPGQRLSQDYVAPTTGQQLGYGHGYGQEYGQQPTIEGIPVGRRASVIPHTQSENPYITALREGTPPESLAPATNISKRCQAREAGASGQSGPAETSAPPERAQGLALLYPDPGPTQAS